VADARAEQQEELIRRSGSLGASQDALREVTGLRLFRRGRTRDLSENTPRRRASAAADGHSPEFVRADAE
jgi:hypothetical protein